MNTLQGDYEQQTELLKLQQDIANTENMTALANLQTARLEFQTEMIKHLE